MHHHTVRKVCAGMAVTSCAMLGAAIASAQQVNPGVTCLRGIVDSAGYSLLDSNYKDSIWDASAAIRLRAKQNWDSDYDDDDSSLKLTVTDNLGATVCQASDDSRIRCAFSFSPAYEGIFTIRIDNFGERNRYYRLCAE